jgi:hypothetical protein
MSKIVRWALVGVSCAACGFAGSVGGLALMQDRLQGEDGASGPAGPPGLQGPPGPAGPAGPEAETVGLSYDVSNLRMRVADLENATEDCGLVTQLVTDVSTFPGLSGPTLNVRKTPFLVCVTPE